MLSKNGYAYKNMPKLTTTPYDKENTLRNSLNFSILKFNILFLLRLNNTPSAISIKVHNYLPI